MIRIGVVGAMAVLAAAFAPPALRAQTIDEKFKKLDPNLIHVEEHTKDQCRNLSHVVTIVSTTDGPITLKPGEVKYFQIAKTDEYTASGGFYWKCGNSDERSRMRGATYVKAVRSAEDGHLDFYRVSIKLK